MNKSQAKLLRLMADGRFHSSLQLSSALGIPLAVTRRIIQSLSDYGLVIIASRGKGYQLTRPLELLDKKTLHLHLDPPVTNLLNRLEIHEEIKSTNQYLLDKSAHCDTHGWCVLAEYQSAGRGRHNHHWLSPFGSGINLSLAWHFKLPSVLLARLSLAVGVAVVRGLSRLGFTGIGLKWPNDLTWQGKKLAGLLVEVKSRTTGCQVVVGIGLNVAFPIGGPTIDQPWTDLAGIKDSLPSRNLIAAELISTLLLLLEHYLRTGFIDVIAEWRKYDCICGKFVRIGLSGHWEYGYARRVDDNGNLLVLVDGKEKKYTAGEISLQRV